MHEVIVIGGGPAGLMASVSAAEHGARVLLLDKGDKLGRKLAISGGGRCNVTNRMPLDELIAHIPGNGRFMYSPFSVFNNEDIIRFFERLGIALKEEDRGRMFPVSDKATTVVQTLLKRINDLGVTVRTNTAVASLEYDDGRIAMVQLKNGERLKTKTVIVATGGQSVPHTGSTGDAYPWAKAAGHTITELYPTEVPITSAEPFIQEKKLQGLSLRDIELSVYAPNGKQIKTHDGDMIFTHFGLSGPAALRCSQYVVKALKKYKQPTIEMRIDLRPTIPAEALFQETIQNIKAEPKKALKTVLRGIAPERFLQYIYERLRIDSNLPCASVRHEVIREIVQQLKSFSFHVNGTLSIEKAFVTGGGVSVKEIEPKTMHSKKKAGLFFCGEVLDIHGYTGGYNITCAFSTGYTAGKGAAEYVHHKS
ncbi:NAD(P)/FAD-dependent oxidoreductase [Halalkalibacterium halodurans]|uniref:BH3279 protein n=1 Tax=Halalkalibacterium halodurans (strain ATCC BAA-125 / DSM 18197 / FERM 7344 / JCM 9153 / C-125) TaxID=272558 RepID=Q9K7T0_HALH5|nr:NAD(P)/FAD-dependent oxidoreductase [Halalkalibacterium halodurans]MDY7223812.1 NAD(P)/FAD-dependent oxidoreductase [Halalkalibacterium halodurans]MDY7243033.1 NAD(P)/FAD-dependent oxidoreductase [Halalkalibacterium halodurans]MED4079968.1 NAD(P)/FAD-dependent oxidoreductase [Halalkalibacterium halodurans]MED4084460.1 NAD(P)/FAD-dependent oxidoreductase [Halalkalibacterium halodurans]MED4104944.1 NAD(P)/FAD-dependent oxidoreductase [Halalkalibacterium halodurans]